MISDVEEIFLIDEYLSVIGLGKELHKSLRKANQLLNIKYSSQSDITSVHRD